MGIAVLGPLTVGGDPGEATLWRRDRIVLAALAVRPGQVVTAEALADMLWGAHLPLSWQKVIQGCVVRLRKRLGSQAIGTAVNGYRLAVPLDEIDAHRFDRAVRRARELIAADAFERAATVLSDALELWRGKPFTELEEWDLARVEAARLTELRFEAEELYVEAALRAGQLDRVLATAQALVSESPLRERRWILLATAQYQDGRQGDALHTIQQLRTVLSQELGLDPTPDVTSLEQAILHQDPALIRRPAALPEPT